MPSQQRFISVVLFTLLMTVCVAASVKADTIYTYNGNPFNEFGGTPVCPPICKKRVPLPSLLRLLRIRTIISLRCILALQTDKQPSSRRMYRETHLGLLLIR